MDLLCRETSKFNFSWFRGFVLFTVLQDCDHQLQSFHCRHVRPVVCLLLSVSSWPQVRNGAINR